MDPAPEHAHASALSPAGPWPRRLEAVGTAAMAVLLVAALATGSWAWAALAGLALVCGLLGLRRTRPGAVRERARREAEALADWTPERLRGLAVERGIDPAQAPVALIAAVRRADPRLSLPGAKGLVDRLR